MTFLLDHDVPEGIRFLLTEIGHSALVLRDVLPVDAPDAEVLAFAERSRLVLITCNRDDFLRLTAERDHHGLIVLIRRKNRAEERAALLRLLHRAGDVGIRNNVNFA
ncbi:MAG: DUF5615 family PIN-like protein [Acidobacteria bacterium]|nr:DUF5615 family PIN-like protein [Acidobacteriota bacterium]